MKFKSNVILPSVSCKVKVDLVVPTRICYFRSIWGSPKRSHEMAFPSLFKLTRVLLLRNKSITNIISIMFLLVLSNIIHIVIGLLNIFKDWDDFDMI